MTDKWYTHTSKPVCEYEDTTMLRNQKYVQKGRVNTEVFIYRYDQQEHEMYDYSSNSNKRFKEKFGSHTRDTINRFTIKDSYTRSITHDTESTAV